MLLVSAVGAVGFTFGKVLDIQISNSSAYESGIGAYYAAESGIEEGFLRYRVSRGANAVPTDGQVPTFANPTAYPYPAQNWLAAPDNVFRTNLSTSTLASTAVNGIAKTSPIGITTDLNSQFYDLRMGAASKDGNPIGTLAGNSDLTKADLDEDYHIARDETRKIDLGDMFSFAAVSDITLTFKPVEPLLSTQYPAVFRAAKCVVIEVKLQLQQSGTDKVTEKKTLLYNPTGCSSLSPDIISDLSTAKNYAYNATSNIGTMSNLRAEMSPAVGYDRATLFLKPIGAGIYYSLKEIGLRASQHPLNSANNTITSTGYFGGTARTLQADVSLQNGSLYDLYDYVIFKNN
ncbi:hypothetical protein COT78_00710 [Candidatus Berkelbacteria bacterium CG10_big_fil_rev_8_21_14_0_10_43_13]|uniref:Uncharacterized protein n=1 Tax=Candidatus Berkelbacteria bacterium CG10_big_fil_rev_8_21_14_0_10_43_13 TaxID=1974514 RepID=A0A2H0W7C9_9BACT|nr:MAG: hypothetical protein COT78_00710 [Candidatus Berkelbacteria bacterium CG10_big_fil_rev_8_21_14_0_10_43_13]